jgi:hypothetical protein
MRQALSGGNTAFNSWRDNHGLLSASSIVAYPAGHWIKAACWVDANDSSERLAVVNKALPVSGFSVEALLAAASKQTLPTGPPSCNKGTRDAGLGYVPWHTLPSSMSTHRKFKVC